MSQHVISLQTNLIVFGVLIVLLVLTVAVALGIEAGPAVEVPIALGIALVKAVVIAMYFMHLKFSNKLTWLFAGASSLWMVILVGFLLSDFLSRDWLRAPVVTDDARAASYFGSDPMPQAEVPASGPGAD